MTARTWSLIVAAVLALGLPTLAAARGMGRPGGGPGAWRNKDNPDGNPNNPNNKDDARKFIVIQSGDTDGNVTFDAIPATELKSRVDELPVLYRDALKEWAVKKAEADKSGEKLARAKPTKPFVQDYMDTVYPSLNLAQSVAKKCQERWEKDTPRKGEKQGDAKATDDKAGAAAPRDDKAVKEAKPGE